MWGLRFSYTLLVALTTLIYTSQDIMPPYAITDVVTADGTYEGRISDDINAQGTNTKRGARTLNERVQAIKTEHSRQGTVKSIPGGDPSRFTLNPLIDACFVCMSNALTQSEHIQDPREVVTAAVEMDEYHVYLRSLPSQQRHTLCRL
jgi:hypothetical protein